MSEKNDRTYIAIDLKSFYSSVECAARGLDPLTTNLVVADVSRTEKTICLAVSPSLKAYGLGGRARLFEVVEKMRQVNAARRAAIGGRPFTGKSLSSLELAAHPDWEADYIAATPRMAEYIRVSSEIYGVYLKYISPDDMHVYSIDEIFADVTDYLRSYGMTAHELAMTMIRDVLATTGITATAGIGTNLFLAKVAMDVVAKHLPADSDGVRIASLDEMSYRRTLWNHRPLTDFWRMGRGIAARLALIGIDTMGGIARQSVKNEEVLYRLFGINAELIIDHAWGWEPATMECIKAYRPSSNSLGSGQVLHCPYTAAQARVAVMEMADTLALELVDRHLVGSQVSLAVGYDRSSFNGSHDIHGAVATDWYGRAVPKPAHGSVRLPEPTASSRLITEAVTAVFDRVVDRSLLVRRLNVTIENVIGSDHTAAGKPVELDLFADNAALEAERKKEKENLEREQRLQTTLLKIKKEFGKNAILKGLNFADGATQRERNNQIGGHKA